MLGDRSGNVGWHAWHRAAGLPYKPSRTSQTILDSNSRVQSVIDGQGLGLWDATLQSEFDWGALVAVSDVWLEDAGYYIVMPAPELKRVAEGFRQWLLEKQLYRKNHFDAWSDNDLHSGSNSCRSSSNPIRDGGFIDATSQSHGNLAHARGF